MHLKKLFVFGLLAAVLPAVAEEAADRKTATSLKYVEHELDTRQNKFTAESNKAMEYTDSAGDVQKRAVTSELGTSTSDTSLPMVGGVNTKLNQKQDDIDPVNDHTAVTYTGTAGTIGQKGIYQATESYVEQSDNLIDAKTFNAALKRGLDSEFICSEYKPDTNLCWVYSIHNNETTNLIDWSQSVTHEVISSNVWTRYQVELPIAYGTWTCKHTSVPAGTYTVSLSPASATIITYVNGQATAFIPSDNKVTVTLNDAGEIWVFCANDSQMAAITQAQIVPGTSGEMLPYTTLVPAGFTPVEYIEGTGTQYLNTGVKYGASEHVKYNIDFKVTAFTNTGLWGGLDTTRTGAIWLNSNMFKGSMGATSSASSPIAIPFDTNKHSAVFSAGLTPSDANVNLFFDGILYSMPYIYDEMYMGTNKDIMLFYGYGSSAYQPAKMQVYKFQIYLDDELRFNGIPVKQGTTVGMYDTVSGEFLTSVPTNTNFRAGPEISNIIYVPQNQ